MLELKHITKYYDQDVLVDVNYTFNDCGLYIIVGDSGCGKTTLLNIIANIDSDYQGSVFYNHQDIRNLNNYRKDHLSFLFQDFNLIDNLNVKDNYSLTKYFKDTFKNIDDILELLKLKLLKRKRINKISGGQKQRVALLRAINNNSDIILCDEPTGSLDSSSSKEIFELLQQISQEKLVIVITHDYLLAKEYGKHILKIDNHTLNTIKENQDISPVYHYRKTKKKSNLLSLSLMNFKMNRKLNMTLVSAIVLSILCILITFTVLNGTRKQINKQIQNLLPNNQVVVVSKNNHLSKDNLNDINNKYINYRYLEADDYEFVGLGNNKQYNDNNITYISDNSKAITSEDLSSGHIPNKDNEIVVSKSTANHLKTKYHKYDSVYGWYLNNNTYKSIKLKVVGVTKQATLLDTIYIKQYANISHINTIFEKEVNCSVGLINFKTSTNLNLIIKSLNKTYSNYSFNITNTKITNNINNTFDSIERILLYFSLLAIVSSCFLLGEVLYLSVIKRKKIIGLYQVLGASKFEIGFMILLEGIIITSISYIISLTLMTRVTDTINMVINNSILNGANSSFIVIDYKLVIIIYLITIILAIISCIIPSLNALKIDIIKALKS